MYKQMELRETLPRALILVGGTCFCACAYLQTECPFQRPCQPLMPPLIRDPL